MSNLDGFGYCMAPGYQIGLERKMQNLLKMQNKFVQYVEKNLNTKKTKKNLVF